MRSQNLLVGVCRAQAPLFSPPAVFVRGGGCGAPRDAGGEAGLPVALSSPVAPRCCRWLDNAAGGDERVRGMSGMRRGQRGAAPPHRGWVRGE